ncbi:helix-turn-helix domain-containing protein [Nocardia sp. NBC_00508]|nr:helix-turn-helix domain-containing protein [Nocardia sp. NBC_00508]WUD65910.1 helix-turn-helix domain-containing protein [Nocardia sp. NBC_00508]
MATQMVIKLVDSSRRPPQFLIGSRNSHVAIEGACTPSYIELSLDPLGAYSLLDTPGIEMSGRLVELADVLGRRSREFADRIRDEPTWRSRFELLDGFLLDRAAIGRQVSPEVRRAWALLTATGGAIPIRRIVEDVGWSHKHLIAKFTQQVGVPPKAAARLVRFERARRHLLQHPESRLHEVAATYGYADQSHFNRDFRGFTGVTPTEYLGMTGSPPESPPPSLHRKQQAAHRVFPSQCLGRLCHRTRVIPCLIRPLTP